jgi:hypothetical protein
VAWLRDYYAEQERKFLDGAITPGNAAKMIPDYVSDEMRDALKDALSERIAAGFEIGRPFTGRDAYLFLQEAITGFTWHMPSRPSVKAQQPPDPYPGVTQAAAVLEATYKGSGRLLNQMFWGKWTRPEDKIPVAGNAAEIVVGFIPVVGSVASARDLAHDLTHWKWTKQHALETGLDAFGLFPAARGLIKFARGAKEVKAGVQAGVGLGKAVEETGEAVAGAANKIDDGINAAGKSGAVDEAKHLADNGPKMLEGPKASAGSAAAGAGSEVAAATASVWKLSPFARGKAIEKQLAATEYKDWFHVGAEDNGFFELVDFQKGQTLVSLKSVDTAGKTWVGKMQAHIDDLAHRGAMVNDQPANMVLDIRVQPGGEQAAQRLVAYGKQNNVTVVVKEFP